MTIYKLEETPNTYIGAFFHNKFIYRMIQFLGESNTSIIRDIDLRRDKLMVHGTELKESMSQKLHDSLVLRPRTGKIYVNCNGACYICVTGKGTYRPIDNVIFDWSPFGVVVPNSVNDSLTKQLQHKDKELAVMSSLLSAAKNEASANKDSLEASHRVIKETEDMKSKLQNVQQQVSSVEAELQSSKIELESSNKDIKEIEYRLSFCRKENQDIVTELHKVRNELCSSNIELQSCKRQFESSCKKITQLEDELSGCRKESEAKHVEFSMVQEQFSMIKNELQQSIQILFEFTETGVEKLDDKYLGRCYVIKAIDIVDE